MKKRKKKLPAALDPNKNPRTRWELITDFDYLDKLSKEEMKYLEKFIQEFVHASFHYGERLHPVKKVNKKYKNGKTKKLDKYRNEAEGNNNARNRCVHTRGIATHTLLYPEHIKERAENSEDEMIAALDAKILESKRKKFK